MKLNNNVNKVETYGNKNVEQVKFKLSSNAKLFELLSDGIYQDKIGAVVREISCNGYDAMKMVGKEKDKITITLPTDFEPTFRVRDYGPGLSHHDVMNLYTTYGYSTKDDSNDYIGALGIGSKSPLAYTSSFTVVSRHLGTTSTYVCAKGEDGIPVIESWHSVDDEEHYEDGLEVIVPVESKDYTTFREAVRKQCKYFDPLPKIDGNAYFEFERTPFEDYEHKWKNIWYDSRYSYGGRRQRVVMGVVEYELDFTKLTGLTAEQKDMFLTIQNNLSTLVEAPLGAVSISPSRETLTYDKVTSEFIVSTFEGFLDEQWEEKQKEISACSSLKEAMKKYETVEKLLRNYKDLMYGSFKVSTSHRWKTEDYFFEQASLDHIRWSQAGGKGLASWNDGLRVGTDAVFIIKDKAHKYKIKSEAWARNRQISYRNVVLLQTTLTGQDFDDWVKALKKNFPGWEIKLTSELPDVKGVARSKAGIYTLDLNMNYLRSYNPLDEDDEDEFFEDEEPTYYFVTKNKQLDKREFDMVLYYRGLTIGTQRKFTEKNTLLIPVSREKELSQYKNMINAYEPMVEECRRILREVGPWAARLYNIWVSADADGGARDMMEIEEVLKKFGYPVSSSTQRIKSVEMHESDWRRKLEDSLRKKKQHKAAKFGWSYNTILRRTSGRVGTAILHLGKSYIQEKKCPFVRLDKPKKTTYNTSFNIKGKSSLLSIIDINQVTTKEQAEFLNKIYKGEIK